MYSIEDLQKFNFPITGYQLFDIPKDHTNDVQHTELSRTDRIPNEIDFCNCLPKTLRPLKLSLCTTVMKLPVGNISQKSNLLQMRLLLSLGFLEHLPNIFVKMVEHHLILELGLSVDTVVSCLMSFLEKLKISIIDGLQASVQMNGNEIGSLSAPSFVLNKLDEERYALYISESAIPEESDWVDMSQLILMEIAKLLNVDVSTFLVLIDPLKECLQIESYSSLSCLQLKYHLQAVSPPLVPVSESDSSEDLLIPNLGRTMPLEFVRRLDRSIDNIYRPEEWVGYEITEHNFVWAIVLQVISNTNVIDKEYVILLSKDDIAGTKVSSLDLYKIMPLHVDIANSESTEILRYDKASTSASASKLMESLSVKELKKKVSEELQMMCELTSDKAERKKVIKRLFFKYHPDKCEKGEEKVYEEVFKYLQQQIDLLEEENPSGTESSSTYYNRWSEHVPKHNYSRSYRSSNNFFEEFQSRPSPTVAKHWLKQARADSVAMRVLKNDRSHVCQVIFLAHEVVEKSLKAGMHALTGLNRCNLANHNLRYFAESIRSVIQEDSSISLVRIADRLSPYYESSRYPDKHMNVRAPVDVYELHEAEEAAELAMIALEFIERKIN